MEKLSSSIHPDEETLDLFAMGRLNNEDFLTIRKHVEECEKCQVRCMDAGEFYNDLSDSIREDSMEKKHAVPRFRWFGNPAFVTAGVMAAAVLIAMPFIRTPEQPQSIELAAFRGNSQVAGVGLAKAGSPINLKIDITGISESNDYFIEVVDSNGRMISRSAAKVVGTQVQIEHKPLSSGQYWVRVSTQPGQPVREMGLEVR